MRTFSSNRSPQRSWKWLPQDLIRQDRVLQRTVEQVLDIPVPRMVKEVFELPKMVSVRQVVEEILEVIQIIPQERNAERSESCNVNLARNVLREDETLASCGALCSQHQRGLRRRACSSPCSRGPSLTDVQVQQEDTGKIRE